VSSPKVVGALYCAVEDLVLQYKTLIGAMFTLHVLILFVFFIIFCYLLFTVFYLFFLFLMAAPRYILFPSKMIGNRQ
jgi:hypothetical protein